MTISRELFESLEPADRGYIVYMCGSRDDQPNVPDETNPYPGDSVEHQQWADGQLRAEIDAQDSEE